MSYVICLNCDAITPTDKLVSDCDKGHRDSSGFQIEPDDEFYRCPECHNIDLEDFGEEEMLEKIKSLKQIIVEKKNIIRNQRLELNILKEENKNT